MKCLYIAAAMLLFTYLCSESICARDICYDNDIYQCETETNSTHPIIDVLARVLIFKPSTNNLYYAAEALPFNIAIATPIESPRWAIFDLHPNYNVGFDLGLGLVFPSRCSELFVHWEHFKSCTQASHRASLDNSMVGPFSSIGPDSAPYNHARGTVQFNFDEVDVLYGHTIDCNDYFRTTIAGGVSFVNLKQCVTSFYFNESGISRNFIVPSSFIGAGPQGNIALDFAIKNGFSFTGQLAIALLAGTCKNHTTILSMSPLLVIEDDPLINKQGIVVEKRFQMIPSFAQRIGFVYSFDYCNDYHGCVEAGWESKIFINALQSTDLNSGVEDITPVESTVGVFARTFRRTLGDFALVGPYVAFNVSF